ncbi:lysophospholipid acyltransferase family protein [Agitococcus lubricus]|uniref:1-acyl-sn-glycerol-3-phosphate acyltransferase n=1 Tax=Agitococcus lubricus TaxID=1077255 RepID=A0A2T5J1U7_9GAMM|nr:lysophospholipid acyltransferase family protein [Agitococcus lubricus]PTQ90323.1 1-acyl-sn-glycerol-3-phosphate acyltransferase [Agitococcus lubricus]
MRLKKFEDWLLPADLKQNIDNAPKALGSLDYDRWGYHKETAYKAAALMRYFYERYFQVQAFGREHIPAQGRVMVVGNHSGYLPLDGMLVGYSLLTNPYAPRVPRAMIERLFTDMPYMGNLLNKIGAVTGEVQNCYDMLKKEEAIIIFPEGMRGTSKGFARRYQLQRFGNGFMHIAIETNTPIIPVGIVGCEEALPMFGNAEGLAKKFNLPYFPITVPFPIPTRVTLVYGEPMYFDGPIHCEEDLEAKVNVVKAKIRQLIQQAQDKNSDRR